MSLGSAPILRIFLADDHAAAREGVSAVLRQEGFDLVGSAADGYSAVKMCEALQPDVALLNVSMPIINGIDAGREIRKSSPATKVILITTHGEDLIVLAGLRAGVAGFVLKSLAVSTLVQAIEAVWRNGVYLSPGISRTIVETFVSRPSDALSLREREVLRLMAQGKNMKEIGDVLFISVRIAETHRARIMTKLNIHHIPGLVHYAIQRGLVTSH